MKAVAWTDPWATLVVAAAVLLAGAGLLRRAGFRASCGPELLGCAFAAGAAWLALAVTLASAFGDFASAPVLGAALALAAASPWLPPRGPADAEARAALRRGWLGFAPALLACALSFWFATVRPVWNIDSQRRWTMHAQWLAEYDTVVPERVEDPTWAHTHPTYPPLVPALAGLGLQLGGDRDMGVRPLFPFFLLALLGALYGHARRVAGPRASPWIVLAFALTPCFLHAGGTGMGADAALADVPLASLLTVLSVLLLRALAGGGAAAPERGIWFACALAALGATLTKKEGTAFTLAMLAATAVWVLFAERDPEGGAAARSLRRARLAGVGAAAGLALLGAVLWRLVSAAMPVEAGEDYLAGGALARLGSQLGRLPTILVVLRDELLDYGSWGLLWAVPPAWLAAQLVRRVAGQRVDARAGPRDPYRLLPGLWLVLGLVVVCAAYVTTGWHGDNYVGLMKVSMTRLVMHHAPLAAVMLAAMFEPRGARERG